MIPVTAGVLAGIAVAYLIGQLAVLWVFDTSAKRYADSILEHSLDVIQAGYHIEEELAKSDAPMCSDVDLDHMRQLAFEALYVADVGRAVDDRLYCTTWGVIDPPRTLPPHDRVQPSGFSLWSEVQHVAAPTVLVDMARRGSVVIFTAPYTFNERTTYPLEFSAKVLTKDASHVFRQYGHAGWLPERPSARTTWTDFNPDRIGSACAEGVDICVIAGFADVSIFEQPILALIGIGLLGALTGGSVGLAGSQLFAPRFRFSDWVERAIAEQRLRIAYQPLVRLRDDRVIGYEALCRLKDERGGSLSPDLFIRLVEENGLIGTVTRYVIRQSLTEMAPRLREPNGPYLSINLTIADTLDPTLCDYLNEVVTRLGIARGRVVLELTERLTASYEELIRGMENFRQNGYSFFIDDFGTGYANLAYLSRLPIDGIKLDKTFVHAMSGDPISATIVADVCQISRTLGVKFVAEGIETAEQAEQILRIHGDAIGQGWHFGRPAFVRDLRTS